VGRVNVGTASPGGPRPEEDRSASGAAARFGSSRIARAMPPLRLSVSRVIARTSAAAGRREREDLMPYVTIILRRPAWTRSAGGQGRDGGDRARPTRSRRPSIVVHDEPATNIGSGGRSSPTSTPAGDQRHECGTDSGRGGGDGRIGA
jgi:hypothetical protein